jgi:hypothetical protein
MYVKMSVFLYISLQKRELRLQCAELVGIELTIHYAVAPKTYCGTKNFIARTLLPY